jgi:hypothetical protein
MPASTAQRIATATRRSQAVAMHLAGADWQTIANRLGYASRGAACTDVTRALEIAAAEAIRDIEVLRQVDLARVDRLQAAYWTAALAGDTDAAKVVQWCIDRRAKLNGTDAPIKHEVVTIGAVEAAIAKLEAQIAAGGSGALPDRADQAGASLPSA